MKDCELMQERISCMIDNELSESELMELKAHIEGCPECRRLYEAFSAVSAELSELEEMPESVAPQVMAAIRPKHKSAWRRILPLAACFAVAIFFGVQKDPPSDSVPDSAVPTAAVTFNAQDKTAPDETDRQLSEDSAVPDTKPEYNSSASGDSALNEEKKEHTKLEDFNWTGSAAPDVPDMMPDASGVPNNSAADTDKVKIDDAELIAKLRSLLGDASAAAAPEDASAECVLYVATEDGETKLKIYFDEDRVFVGADGEMYEAECSASELRNFIEACRAE